MAIRLLTAAANGSGPSFRLSQLYGQAKPARFVTLYVWGVFDSATVRIEVMPPGVKQWFDAGVAITAAGAINLELQAFKIHAVVSGGLGSESITVELV